MCAVTIVLAVCVFVSVYVCVTKRSTDKRVDQAEGKKLLMFDACLEQAKEEEQWGKYRGKKYKRK